MNDSITRFIHSMGGDVRSAVEASLARVKTKVASQILDVSVRTLEDWRRKGVGPKYIRIGTKVRYNVADLHAYLESRTR